MIYQEAGTHQLNFVYDGTYPRLSGQDRGRVWSHWAKLTKDNDRLTPGHIICAHSYHEADGIATIGFNVSDYATYCYARDHKLLIPGTYSMGDCTAIYLRDSDSYFFLERTDHVQYDKGMISLGTGGVLDSPAGSIDESQFLSHIHAHADEETSEEVIAHGLESSMFLGYYVDEKTYKIEFLFSAAAVWAELPLGDMENKRLVHVKRGQLTELVATQPDRLETSSRKHLMYWSRYLDEATY